MTLRVFAPAKINLSLHVGRPQADGRHPLESIVVFADAGDYIWAEDAERPSLAIAGPFGAALAAESNNLVVRAAQLLAAGAGLQNGVKLTLQKNLPIASGIGGGSSDAAAALHALNKLWALGMTDAELANVGAALGADVPACVYGRSCFMTGAGETVAPIDISALSAVLINPGKLAPTGAVYRRFDELNLGGGFVRTAPPSWRDREEALSILSFMRNDLTAPAKDVAPAIADVFSLLDSLGGARLTRLSGSGATVFAIADDAQAADLLAVRISETRPNWWVKPTRLG
ncbi:MAG: 4-(cytidine 5'-diphospho)-2-C-methyl-D-erythritol kinase [Caulobacterales bacterium]